MNHSDPSWSELIQDATKLAKAQQECYKSVHRLLELHVPQLDEKIKTLEGNVPTLECFPEFPTKKEYIESDEDIESLEHLKPLPMPPSDYLKLNRPDILFKAECRVNYLKRRAETRRKFGAKNIIDSWEQIKLSSREQPKKIQRRFNFVPQNYQVRHNFTEKEMRRLTNKIYNSLPEVQKKRKEEHRNLMRVQNYKNRLDYGRKLLENRRQGIINYPIRASSDDVSLCSELNEYPSSDFERAADNY